MPLPPPPQQLLLCLPDNVLDEIMWHCMGLRQAQVRRAHRWRENGDVNAGPPPTVIELAFLVGVQKPLRTSYQLGGICSRIYNCDTLICCRSTSNEVERKLSGLACEWGALIDAIAAFDEL